MRFKAEYNLFLGDLAENSLGKSNINLKSKQAVYGAGLKSRDKICKFKNFRRQRQEISRKIS